MARWPRDCEASPTTAPARTHASGRSEVPVSGDTESPAGQPKPVVRELRTYVDADDVVTADPEAPADERGSLASLVPGGLVEDRPDPRGARQAERLRQLSKPLKINIDLQMWRIRKLSQGYVQTASPEEREAKQAQVERAFLAVMERDPEDVRAYVGLGTLYMRVGRYKEAQEVYGEACALEEGRNAYVWVAMGNLEAKHGDAKAAREYLKAATLADPGHAAGWHAWGCLELRQNRIVEARNILMSGIRAAREPNPFLYETLASLAADVGLEQEARYWFREGTSTVRGARSHAIWTSWGNMEWKVTGDIELAQYCFRQALAIYERSRYVALSWATLEHELGNVERCKELIAQGMRHNPGDVGLIQARALLLAEEGEEEEARAMFRHGARVDRRVVPLWQAWGVFELRLGNHDIARDIFQKGVEYNPNSKDLAWIWQAWGKMESRLGNLSQARALFKAGVQADPCSVACWRGWIRLEETANLYSRAEALRAARDRALESRALPFDFSTMPGADKAGVLQKMMSWVPRRQQTVAAPQSTRTPRRGRVQRQRHDSTGGGPRQREPSGTEARPQAQRRRRAVEPEATSAVSADEESEAAWSRAFEQAAAGEVSDTSWSGAGSEQASGGAGAQGSSGTAWEADAAAQRGGDSDLAATSGNSVRGPGGQGRGR